MFAMKTQNKALSPDALAPETGGKKKCGRKPMPEGRRQMFSARLPPDWFPVMKENCSMRRMSQADYLIYVTNLDRRLLAGEVEIIEKKGNE